MAEITDFGPRKTIFILAIVAGCFAVLWPKIFYPMLTASVSPHHSSDSSACCDVIFESDVTAADIMYEICQNILKHHQVDPRVRDALKSQKLTPQSAGLCREEVLARCGIDLSTFLAERERLGKSNKQVLEEIRTFNSSLCLKIHFGIPLSQLGTPHLIRYHILMPHSTIRQERRTPPHAGGLHPALRERGRAIPSSHIVPKVADRPDHVVPKMRPPLGAAGHVVQAPKGNGTMGIIMPLYTLGIVLFFLYTIVKVLKKNSDSEIISEYSGAAAEKEFRKMVFSPEALASAMTGGTVQYPKERSPSPFNPPPTLEELKDQAAGDIEIDQLRRRLVETEAAMERIVVQMGNISRTVMHSPSSQQELKDATAVEDTHSKTDEELENLEQSPTVKVMGMEMTASCEGGQRGSRPTTPIIPSPPSHIEREKTPPKPIYLEGALPPQCELLVTDSETQEQKTEEDAEAPVVLSGKMTLSLISLDQIAADSEDENGRVEELRDEERKDERLSSDREIFAIEVEDEMLEKELEEESNILDFQTDGIHEEYNHDVESRLEITLEKNRMDDDDDDDKPVGKDQEEDDVVKEVEDQVEVQVKEETKASLVDVEEEEVDDDDVEDEEVEYEVEEEEEEIETEDEEVEEEEIEVEEEEYDEEEEVEVEVEEDDDEEEEEEVEDLEEDLDVELPENPADFGKSRSVRGEVQESKSELPYSEKAQPSERN